MSTKKEVRKDIDAVVVPPAPGRSPLEYASPGALLPPRPPEPLGHCKLFFIVVFCLTGIVSAVLYTSTPLGFVTYDKQGNVAYATFLRQGVYESLSALFMACFFLLLTPGVILVVHRRTRLGISCIVASVWLPLSLWSLGPLRLRADWIVMDRVAASGGPEYFLIAQLRGPPKIGMARLASTGWVYETVNLTSPPVVMPEIPYMLVIRPSPGKSTNPRGLYLTSNDLLVCVDFENICHIVYDIRGQRFYNEDEISQISPFILIDQKSSLYLPDEATILSELTSTKNWHRGLPPSKETLTQALNHPNPAVRQSAARLLNSPKAATNP